MTLSTLPPNQNQVHHESIIVFVFHFFIFFGFITKTHQSSKASRYPTFICERLLLLYIPTKKKMKDDVFFLYPVDYLSRFELYRFHTNLQLKIIVKSFSTFWKFLCVCVEKFFWISVNKKFQFFLAPLLCVPNCVCCS